MEISTYKLKMALLTSSSLLGWDSPVTPLCSLISLSMSHSTTFRNITAADDMEVQEGKEKITFVPRTIKLQLQWLRLRLSSLAQLNQLSSFYPFLENSFV